MDDTEEITPTTKMVKVESTPQIIVIEEPRTCRVIFELIKYIFIFTNVIGGAMALYLLCSDTNGVHWEPDNALIILGLLFWIILAIVGITGAVKEECYVVVTYTIFALVISALSVIHTWRTLIEEISGVIFVLLSICFSILLYRKNPIPSN